MGYLTYVYCVFCFIAGGFCSFTARAQEINTLTKEERKEGWKLLFDGKSLDNWHIYNKGKTASGWKVQNGEIFFQPTGNPVGGEDLITDEEFEDFDLRLEWKISKGGNSGVFFGVQEDPKYPYESYTGIEMQVLDNLEADDRHNPSHLAGALYDLIDASATSKPKPVGEWNQSRILNQKGHITFWLNGVMTAAVDRNGAEWRTLIEKSKFKGSDFGKFNKGKIALQDHISVVAYRNIKIKVL